MVHADGDTDTFKSFIVQADRAFGSFTDRVSVGTVFVFGVLAKPNIILVCTVKYVRYVI